MFRMTILALVAILPLGLAGCATPGAPGTETTTSVASIENARKVLAGLELTFQTSLTTVRALNRAGHLDVPTRLVIADAIEDAADTLQVLRDGVRAGVAGAIPGLIASAETAVAGLARRVDAKKATIKSTWAPLPTLTLAQEI